MSLLFSNVGDPPLLGKQFELDYQKLELLKCQHKLYIQTYLKVRCMSLSRLDNAKAR